MTPNRKDIERLREEVWSAKFTDSPQPLSDEDLYALHGMVNGPKSDHGELIVKVADGKANSLETLAAKLLGWRMQRKTRGLME